MNKKPSNKQLASLLKENKVFGCADETQRDRIAELANMHSFSNGEFIAHLGDTWPYLFILEEGEINAAIDSEEGRSFIAATFNPGDVFWGLAFFQDDAPMPVALEAAQASKLHLWKREDLLPFLFTNGQMSWELNRLLVQRMLMARRIVEELAFHPVTSRLARLLLDQFKPKAGDQVLRESTLDEMAARIGSTREMVCRILYKFSEEGAIQINRTEFTFTEPDLLAKHAHLEASIKS